MKISRSGSRIDEPSGGRGRGTTPTRRASARRGWAASARCPWEFNRDWGSADYREDSIRVFSIHRRGFVSHISVLNRRAFQFDESSFYGYSNTWQQTAGCQQRTPTFNWNLKAPVGTLTIRGRALCSVLAAVGQSPPDDEQFGQVRGEHRLPPNFLPSHRVSILLLLETVAAEIVRVQRIPQFQEPAPAGHPHQFPSTDREEAPRPDDPFL